MYLTTANKRKTDEKKIQKELPRYLKSDLSFKWKTQNIQSYIRMQIQVVVFYFLHQKIRQIPAWTLS